MSANDHPPEGPLSRRDEMSDAQRRYEAEVRTGAAPPPSAAVPRHKAVAAAQARKALAGGGVSLKFTPAAPLANKLWLATGAFAALAVLAFFSIAIHDAVWRSRPWIRFTARSGPVTSPAPPPDMSFTLMVHSTPPGAEVFIDGQARGKTPAMVNISCAGGEEVALRLERAGFKKWQTRVPCQRGGTARSSIALERAP